MADTTTPEVIEPGELRAYPGKDYTTVISGGGPFGQDCIRFNQDGGDNAAQNLFQPVIETSHAYALNQESSIAFWINRRGAWTGTGPNTTGVINSETYRPGPHGGTIFGLGNPTYGSMGYGTYAWAVVGCDTNQLWFTYSYRAHGDNEVLWMPISTNVPLDTWCLAIVNVGAYSGTYTDLVNTDDERLDEAYFNGLLNSSHLPGVTISFGGTYVARNGMGDNGLNQFALGDPQANSDAIQATADGPICDISELTFSNKRISNIDAWNLYESYLYGG